MGAIELLERDVQKLDDRAFASFRAWFLDYEQARWDQQIEMDSASGALDALVDEALADHRSGKSTPL